MSVETLDYSVASFSSLKQLDVLIEPDLGGRFQPNTSLEETIVIARPAERILPPPEPHKPHLERVDRVQERWDLSLGTKSDGRILSYNPVLDRANLERLIEEGATADQIAAFKIDLVREMATNLRERYHAARSVVRYVLDDQGNAYSENNFANEPVDVMFQRGALYRIAQGSPEPERELSAVEGSITAKRELAREETPLHSKRIVISPPGINYKDNFVDIYEASLDPQTARRIIIMSRFASSLSNDEYRERLIHLKPDYFDGFEGSFDAWCLQNPLEGDQRQSHVIFNEEFRGQQQATGEEDMQSILKACSSLIDYYKEVVSGKIFNPQELAKAFNAVLNKADATKEWLINKGKHILSATVNFVKTAGRVFRSAQEEADWFGMRAVKEIAAGCGLSGGFSIGGIKSFISGVIRGIGGLLGFGESDSMGSLYFSCPACGAINKRPREGYVESCQNSACISPNAVRC